MNYFTYGNPSDQTAAIIEHRHVSITSIVEFLQHRPDRLILPGGRRVGGHDRGNRASHVQSLADDPSQKIALGKDARQLSTVFNEYTACAMVLHALDCGEYRLSRRNAYRLPEL